MTDKLSRSQKSRLVGNDIVLSGVTNKEMKRAAVVRAPLEPKNTSSESMTSEVITTKEETASYFNAQDTVDAKKKVRPTINLSYISLDFFAIVMLCYVSFITHWFYAALVVYAVLLLLKYDFQRILISSVISILLVPIFLLTNKHSLAMTGLIMVAYFLILGFLRYLVQRTSSKKLVYNS